ncbi:PxKF domain-containing protein [Azohydromonas australica]|uniref:PxKF domain-containing protein n=1 Tax=Azohydromonas australica TaxID=364039 RepID=UPI0004919C16|nr:PxKF domain-containing protein [Azohydromonas australica]
MAIDAGVFHTVALKSSYRFGGFRGPVNALPEINTLEAGAGVTVRFRLGGNHGLDIFAESFPVSRWVSCRADANTDEIEHSVQARSNSLRYDAETDIYTFVWKTDPGWSGQCHRLLLRFADGIEHTALFRFR